MKTAQQLEIEANNLAEMCANTARYLREAHEVNAALLEALIAAEVRDESIHAFDDLELFVDDGDTRKDYIKEYERRRKQRAAIAKAKAEQS